MFGLWGAESLRRSPPLRRGKGAGNEWERGVVGAEHRGIGNGSLVHGLGEKNASGSAIQRHGFRIHPKLIRPARLTDSRPRGVS